MLDTVLGGQPEIMRLHEHPRRRARSTTRPRRSTRYGDAQTQFEQLNGYALEAEAHTVLAGLGFATDDAERPGVRAVGRLADARRPGPSAAVGPRPADPRRAHQPPRRRLGRRGSRPACGRGPARCCSCPTTATSSTTSPPTSSSSPPSSSPSTPAASPSSSSSARSASTALEAQAAAQAKHLAQQERFIERFRYKATKARQVQSRIKTLEKLEKIEPPTRTELRAKFQFPEPPRTSRVVAELDRHDRRLRRRPRSCATSTSTSNGARRSPSSVRTAPARPRCSR